MNFLVALCLGGALAKWGYWESSSGSSHWGIAVNQQPLAATLSRLALTASLLPDSAFGLLPTTFSTSRSPLKYVFSNFLKLLRVFCCLVNCKL